MHRPDIFADVDLDTALDATAAVKKVLIATTGSSTQCLRMDRATWIDLSSVDWLREQYLVIQIDIERQPALAERFRIGIQARHLPTTILFKDGEEVDRVIGYQSTNQLMTWLDDLARGVRWIDMKRTEVATNPSDMRVRLDLARALRLTGMLDAATTEYVWLWRHARKSLLGRLLLELDMHVTGHQRARDVFLDIRDQLSPLPHLEIESEALADWFSLNTVLGDRASSLRWFDSVKNGVTINHPLAPLLERQIMPLLVARGSWTDAGKLVTRPLTRLAEFADISSRVARSPDRLDETPEEPRGVVAFHEERLRRMAVELVRMLRAADRDDEAASVLEEARRLDSSPEMTSMLADVEGGSDPKES